VREGEGGGKERGEKKREKGRRSEKEGRSILANYKFLDS